MILLAIPATVVVSEAHGKREIVVSTAAGYRHAMHMERGQRLG